MYAFAESFEVDRDNDDKDHDDDDEGGDDHWTGVMPMTTVGSTSREKSTPFFFLCSHTSRSSQQLGAQLCWYKVLFSEKPGDSGL